MKESASEKTTATTTTATQATQEPFFGKQGGGGFFEGAKQNNAPIIQAKLSINEPGDVYEQEADKMADQVVQRLAMPGREKEEPLSPASAHPAAIQTKCETCEEEELQRKEEEEEGQEEQEEIQRQTESATPSTPGDDAGGDLSSRLSASKGGGSPLPKDTRADMELAFGADFSNVRIHTGSEAAGMSKNIHAQAFTHGSDIYFNEGKFDGGSSEGRRLLAHELVHVGQQGGGKLMIQKQTVEKLLDQESTTSTNLTAPIIDQEPVSQKKLWVCFKLKHSVLKDDPTGLAYEDYLQYVYQKNPIQAHDLSLFRGVANRFGSFSEYTVEQGKFKWIWVTVSPLRYLSNYFGFSGIPNDTSLMEMYLLDVLGYDKQVQTPEHEYASVNKMIEKLKDVIGIDSLYQEFQKRQLKFPEIFADIDQKIEPIRFEQSELKKIQNPKDKVLLKPSYKPEPFADPITNKIYENRELFPELELMNVSSDERHLYEYTYDGNLPTSVPEYSVIAKDIVNKSAHSYDSEIQELIERLLVQRIERGFILRAAVLTSPELYVAQQEFQIEELEKSDVYLDSEHRKAISNEAFPIAMEVVRIGVNIQQNENLLDDDELRKFESSTLQMMFDDVPGYYWWKYIKPELDKGKSGAFSSLQEELHEWNYREDIFEKQYYYSRGHLGWGMEPGSYMMKGRDLVWEKENPTEQEQLFKASYNQLVSGINLAVEHLYIDGTPNPNVLPVKGLLVTKQDQIPANLSLFLKKETDGWTLVDLTRPTAATKLITYSVAIEGEPTKTSTHISAINALYEKYADENELPEGKLILQKPKDYFGDEAYQTYEANGTNTFEEWADVAQGIGTVAGAATLVGVVLALIPGMQIPAALLLMGTVVTAGAGITAGGLRIYNRATHGTFAWDASMAQNVIDIVSGLAAGSSLIIKAGGLATSTFGKAVLITNLGSDAASGILLVASVNKQIEDIQAKDIPEDQKEKEINEVLSHAAFSGLLIVVGLVGNTREIFARPKINSKDLSIQEKTTLKSNINILEKEATELNIYLKAKIKELPKISEPEFSSSTSIEARVESFAFRSITTAGSDFKYTWLRFKTQMQKRFPDIDMNKDAVWVKKAWERAMDDANMVGISDANKKIINQYRKDFPTTKFSNYEMDDMLREGYTINPTTNRFNKTPTDKTPSVRKDYVDEPDNIIAHDQLDPDIKSELDALFAEREELRTRQTQLEKEGKIDTDEYSYNKYQIKLRSQWMGETAAEGYMRKTYPGAKKIFPSEDSNYQSTKGEFDQVWELPDGKIIVIEAKGGSSSLGSRMVSNKVAGVKKGTRVEQGTKPYMLDISQEMIKKGGNFEETGNKILDAFEGKTLEYIEIRQSFEKSGGMSPITKKTFDIYGKN